MTDHGFDGWVPVRAWPEAGQWRVRCMRVDKITYAGGFFEQIIAHARGELREGAVWRDAPLDELSAAENTVSPSGFIFHMSRCGSTLLARLLAALTGATLISEAPPIDAVLRAHLGDAAVSDAQRIRWLRAIVGAIATSSAGNGPLFIKFDAWSTLELPLIHRAFPQVPWVFLCREPLEVLRSHAAAPGSHMVPGVLGPLVFGWSAQTAPGSLDEYGAAVLTRICEAAADARASCGRGCVIDYRELPDAAWNRLATFFGLHLSPDELGRMREVSTRDAKNPAAAHDPKARPAATRPLQPLRDASANALRRSYERVLGH